MTDLPFWQSALLQTIGPAITLPFGTWAIAHITARAQRQREEQQLRHDLIVEMAETASSLYLATQRYWRARERENVTGEPLQALRTWLDEQYHEKRGRGEALEARLQVIFDCGEPRQHWHATMDLLTVRYFQLTDPNNVANFERNAGPKHSGLPLEDLKEAKLVLDSYRERLNAAVSSVRTEPLTTKGDRRKRPLSALLLRLRLISDWVRLHGRRSKLGPPLSPA
jgi:hypothetical protein